MASSPSRRDDEAEFSRAVDPHGCSCRKGDVLPVEEDAGALLQWAGASRKPSAPAVTRELEVTQHLCTH